MGYELRRVMGLHADFAVRPGGSGEPLTFMPERRLFVNPQLLLFSLLTPPFPAAMGLKLH